MQSFDLIARFFTKWDTIFQKNVQIEKHLLWKGIKPFLWNMKSFFMFFYNAPSLKHLLILTPHFGSKIQTYAIEMKNCMYLICKLKFSDNNFSNDGQYFVKLKCAAIN